LSDFGLPGFAGHEHAVDSQPSAFVANADPARRGRADGQNIIRRRGGGLDLIDSICFTAPALWFYLVWIIPNVS
jgi:hypothetical protein